MPGRNRSNRAALAVWMLPGLLLLAIPSCYRAAPLDETAILRTILEQPTQVSTSKPDPTTVLASPLTEADAIALAARNPSLRVEQTRVEIAKADARKARHLENPEIRVGNGWQEDPSFGEDRFTMDLRWSPQPLLQHLASIKAAEAAVPAREAEVAEKAWEVRHQVRLAWNQAAFDRAGLRLGVERALLRKAIRDRLAGSPGADPLAGLQADMDAATAEDQAKIQQEQESKALSTLAKLLGLGSSAGLSVVLGSALPECHAQTTRQSSKVTDHPRLRVARAVYAVAEADLQTEVSRQIPWAKWVQVGWGYAPKTDKGNTTYRNQLRLGISLDLPILDWNLGGIAAGKARRQREAELFKEALTEVVGGSNEAAQRWATALERVRHLRTVVVPLADRSVAATSEAVDSGRLTEIELLKARLEALKIRQALLEATQACREAAIDAEAASGQPSPELMPTATVP